MTITVSSLHIYPLKSAKGVDVDSVHIGPRGAENDRLWMIVNAEGPDAGKAITQRDKGCEKLVHVLTSLSGNNALTCTAPDMGSLVAQAPERARSTVQVWDDICKAGDAGDDAARWFSRYLERPCRLVRVTDDTGRPVDPSFSKPGDQVSFADGFPLLVTSESSLEKLSAHFQAGANIGMDRFRPNIVLKGTVPFQEDIIEKIRIGGVEIDFAKPCSRCKMTVVNQQTGQLEPGDPLRALSRVRRGKSGGVYFGENAIARTFGVISRGDPVEILSTRPMPPLLEGVKLKPEL